MGMNSFNCKLVLLAKIDGFSEVRLGFCGLGFIAYRKRTTVRFA